MHVTIRKLAHSLSIALVALPSLAGAASFPPDADWASLRCKNRPMTDAYRDEANATDELDLVGNDLAPAGLRAADADYAYLRLRVDADPRTSGGTRPAAWGFAIDTDHNFATYEILISANRTTGLVSVYRNTAITLANSPSDPADGPPVASFPFATHLQIKTAPGTDFGGQADYFVDVAIPWSLLAQLGFSRSTPVRLWAGSSTVADRLDADIACHDGRSGAASLSDNVSDGEDFSRAAGTGPGSTIGPVGAGGLEFQGGPGCSIGAGSSAWGLIAALALALAIARQRRARSK